MNQLQDKKILLGISGGIAAYKCADLVRKLKQLGATVKIVMTKSAEQFITPMALQAVSGEIVRNELFDADAERAMGHIELARWADCILIAPATANFLAKLAHGLADDLLSTLCLVSSTKIIVCPAMNKNMWSNIATQDNYNLLISRGFVFIGPTFGEQACGEIGYGRMSEVLDIIEQLQHIQQEKLLLGQHVLITAGPTREPIDPVRYISNNSSGKMGYALAKSALLHGAKVTLISGPTSIDAPDGVNLYRVNSAKDMLNAVMQHLEMGMIFIGAAAVADYTYQFPVTEKLKKQNHVHEMQLSLIKTADILAEVVMAKKAKFVVGFAAETSNLIEHATQKLYNKSLDMIIANDVSGGKVFDLDHNEVLIITKNQHTELKLNSKDLIAQQIIAKIAITMQNI